MLLKTWFLSFFKVQPSRESNPNCTLARGVFSSCVTPSSLVALTCHAISLFADTLLQPYQTQDQEGGKDRALSNTIHLEPSSRNS